MPGAEAAGSRARDAAPPMSRCGMRRERHRQQREHRSGKQHDRAGRARCGAPFGPAPTPRRDAPARPSTAASRAGGRSRRRRRLDVALERVEHAAMHAPTRAKNSTAASPASTAGRRRRRRPDRRADRARAPPGRRPPTAARASTRGSARSNSVDRNRAAELAAPGAASRRRSPNCEPMRTSAGTRRSESASTKISVNSSPRRRLRRARPRES